MCASRSDSISSRASGWRSATAPFLCGFRHRLTLRLALATSIEMIRAVGALPRRGGSGCVVLRVPARVAQADPGDHAADDHQDASGREPEVKGIRGGIVAGALQT